MTVTWRHHLVGTRSRYKVIGDEVHARHMTIWWCPSELDRAAVVVHCETDSIAFDI